MTTIVGIKTEDAVVLVSDTRINYYQGAENTRVKDEESKITWTDHYALAASGSYSKHLGAFYTYLRGKKSLDQYLRFIANRKQKDVAYTDELVSVLLHLQEKYRENLPDGLGDKLKQSPSDPVQRAIAREYFFEFNALNRLMLKRKTDDDEDDPGAELAIATRSPTVDLYRVDIMGNVLPTKDIGDFDIVYLGSGSETAYEYFDNEQYLSDPLLKRQFKRDEMKSEALTIPLACWLGIGAVKRAAEHDTQTSAYVDWAVITKDKVSFFGPDIRKVMKQAEIGGIAQTIETLVSK